MRYQMVTWWFVSLFLLFKLWYHSCRLGRWNLYKNGIEHELLTRLVFFLHRESRDIPVMLVWEDTGAAVQVGGEFGKADKYLSSKQGTEAAPLILQQLTLVKNIWWQGGRFNLIKRTASYRFKNNVLWILQNAFLQFSHGAFCFGYYYAKRRTED